MAGMEDKQPVSNTSSV